MNLSFKFRDLADECVPFPAQDIESEKSGLGGKNESREHWKHLRCLPMEGYLS